MSNSCVLLTDVAVLPPAPQQQGRHGRFHRGDDDRRFAELLRVVWSLLLAGRTLWRYPQRRYRSLCAERPGARAWNVGAAPSRARGSRCHSPDPSERSLVDSCRLRPNTSAGGSATSAPATSANEVQLTRALSVRRQRSPTADLLRYRRLVEGDQQVQSW